MKAKFIYSTVLFLALLIFVSSNGMGGPVIPNEAIVTGTVSGFEKASPYPQKTETEKAGYYRVTIIIESSEVVYGEENLLTNKKGEHITFYTKEPLMPTMKYLKGKRIKVNISYRGDEHGGIWWGYNLQIIPK